MKMNNGIEGVYKRVAYSWHIQCYKILIYQSYARNTEVLTIICGFISCMVGINISFICVWILNIPFCYCIRYNLLLLLV